LGGVGGELEGAGEKSDEWDQESEMVHGHFLDRLR
jgi:hypothetical protein